MRKPSQPWLHALSEPGNKTIRVFNVTPKEVERMKFVASHHGTHIREMILMLVEVEEERIRANLRVPKSETVGTKRKKS